MTTNDAVDLRLIRLFGRHFHDLRGARTLSIAASAQVAATAWLRTGSQWQMYAYGAAALVLATLLMWPAERYYRRFGRVVTHQSTRLAVWLPATAVLAVRAQSHVLQSWPNAIAFLGAAVAAWLAWDSRPYRWHWLLVAGAAAYVAFGSAGDRGGGFASIAPRMWALSLALVLAGVCDHLLFVRALRVAPVAVENEP
jgi:hypothetical protein